jgi:hypothetical protein
MEAGAARFTMVADLPRWLIDLDGVMELTEHENSPKIRVALNGPIDNPERTIDTRELQAFLVTRLVESAIRNYGEGEGEGEGEGVRDLLNVLTGNQGASGESEAQQPQPEAEAEEQAATEEEAPQLDEPNQEMDAETLLNILTDTQGTAGQGETSEPAAPAEEAAPVEEAAPAEEPQAATAEPAEEEQPQELDAQTLFNILTGSQGNAGQEEQEQPASEPAQAEEQQQEQQQQQLDTEQLLQNLLQGSN